jgi:HAD superfamily hydrolase (TIGR01509 family)
METRHLIFDLGNVLWQLDYAGWLDNFRTYDQGITKEKLNDFIVTYLNKTDERKVSDREYLEKYGQFMNDPGITQEKAYALHVRLLAKGPKKAMSLLPELQKRYKLYLISNINPWHIRYVEETFPRFMTLFEKRLYSFEIGLVKPSEEIFLYFKKLTDVDFNNAVFFDDMAENVDAANRLGLESIRVEDDDSFCTLLRNRFLL